MVNNPEQDASPIDVITQEDFEMAVSKVMKKDADSNVSLARLWK